MTARFAFDFGPVPNFENPVFAMVAVPADAEREVFYVSDRRQGLERVRAAYPGDQIAVALNLADEARALGLACGSLPAEQLGTFAAATLDFAAADHFAAIADEAALGRFVCACLAFQAAKPWIQPPPQRVLRATVSGGVAGSADIAVLGPPEDNPGFTAYLGKGTLDRVLDLAAVGDLAGAAALDQLTVSLQVMPPWIGNTMRAVLGASGLPIPVRVRNGARVHVDVCDLLTLTGIAQAIAKLSFSGGERSTASIDSGVHHIVVNLTRRA